MKIEGMVDVFLILANFAPHAFLNLAPPSDYALILKALMKVSKVSWTSFIWKKIWQDKFHFSKKTPPKSPYLLGQEILQVSNSLSSF